MFRETHFACVLRAVFLAMLANAWTTRAAEERFTEQRDERHGRLLLLRNEAVQPTAAQVAARGKSRLPATLPMRNTAELAQPEWTNAVAVARKFLARHGGKFASANPPVNAAVTRTGLADAFDAARDLTAVAAERDALGMTHVRFHQTYRGLPVFGAELTVHLTSDQ